MIEEIKKTSHHIERFEAVDGATPSPLFQKAAQDKQRVSRYSALLSHQNMVAEAQKRGWDEVLILEDDVELCSDFDKRMDVKLPKNWMILYLGVFPYKEPIQVSGFSDKLFRVIRSFGTFAYVINNTAYQRILRAKPYSAIDRIIADDIQSLGKCYCIRPFLVRVREDYSDVEFTNRTLDNINRYYEP